MECNKDEAARAKRIAENKFSQKDYTGAKKFALMAHNMYPALEGLPQFLSSLNVYIAAEYKINGEMDWYAILGVNDSLADDETIRKQYRQLLLSLHPDKNNSLDAVDAFKHVSEAWSILSDETKRLAYNNRRRLDRFHHNAPLHIGSQSNAPLYNLKRDATSYDLKRNATSDDLKKNVTSDNLKRNATSYGLKRNATSDERTGNNNTGAPSSVTSRIFTFLRNMC